MIVLKVLGGVALLLVGLALLVYATAKGLHDLFMLITGKVPMHRIVRVLVVMLIFVAIIAAVVIPVGRKMIRTVEPQAEDRVRANSLVRNLLGEPITFGSARGIHFEADLKTGTGGFSLKVQGRKATGDLDLEAEEMNGAWRLSSVTLVMGDQRVPIPAQ